MRDDSKKNEMPKPQQAHVHKCPPGPGARRGRGDKTKKTCHTHIDGTGTSHHNHNTKVEYGQHRTGGENSAVGASGAAEYPRQSTRTQHATQPTRTKKNGSASPQG